MCSREEVLDSSLLFESESLPFISAVSVRCDANHATPLKKPSLLTLTRSIITSPKPPNTDSSPPATPPCSTTANTPPPPAQGPQTPPPPQLPLPLVAAQNPHRHRHLPLTSSPNAPAGHQRTYPPSPVKKMPRESRDRMPPATRRRMQRQGRRDGDGLGGEETADDGGG